MKKWNTIVVLFVLLMTGCPNSTSSPPVVDPPILCPAYYSVYPWTGGVSTVPPVLTAGDIKSGTGIQGSKATQDLEFKGEGWIWFASRWGQVSAIYDIGSGHPMLVNSDTYTSYDVAVEGMDYTVYVFNTAGDYDPWGQLRYTF